MATTTPLVKAVVHTGGKQYLVGIGSTIKVEKLITGDSDAVVLDTIVMAADADNKLVPVDQLPKVSVQATLVEHGKGKKIRVFTFKSKKRQRRTLGHRQQFTALKITGITMDAN